MTELSPENGPITAFIYAHDVEIGVSGIEVRLRFRNMLGDSASAPFEVVMAPDAARAFAALLLHCLADSGDTV
jgi:hypothetical protein